MSKIIIYQIFLRHFSLKKGLNIKNGTIKQNLSGKFSSLNTNFFREVKKLNITHLWLTGVIEHASQTSYKNIEIEGDPSDITKGIAGSPYAIRDYYNLSPDLADFPERRMDEFDELIDKIHKNKLSLIIDFVPNHLARVYKSKSKPNLVKDFGEGDDSSVHFSPENNFYYLPNEKFSPQFEIKDYKEYPAKVTGNDCFSASPSVDDWYETVKLNYGVDYLNNKQQYFDPIPNTWLKMRDILLFWADRGVDGFRCDMAEMVPVEFWHWVIKEVKKKFPEILFVAEIYNPQKYSSYVDFGGFDILYDKVGLYDTLRQVVCDELPAKNISYCWQSLNGLQNRMLNFLENHDEQRIASNFFASNPLKAMPAVTVSALMNTNPFMLYAGQELSERGMDEEGFSGIDGRNSIFDYYQPDSLSRWINGGKYNLAGLTKEERKVRREYSKILNIAQSDVVSEGLFYDLTYANIENPDFNSEKCFAFLRVYKKETLLVLVNFSENTQHMELIVPKHAFDFLKIKEEKFCVFVDLLTDRQHILHFNSDDTISLDIIGYSSLVLYLPDKYQI